MIQETGNWDPSGEYGGWACYKSNVMCKAAILLPPEILTAIRWSSSDSSEFAKFQYCIGCIVSDIGMVSTYFVNQNASDDLFKMCGHGSGKDCSWLCFKCSRAILDQVTFVIRGSQHLCTYLLRVSYSYGTD